MVHTSSAQASSADGAQQLEQARLAFARAPHTLNSLAAFGRVICDTRAIRNPSHTVIEARLTAAVEYLDAGLRLPLDDEALDRAADVARIATEDVQQELPGEECDTDDVTIQSMILKGHLLSMVVSALLTGRTAPVVPEGDWHTRIEKSAWEILDYVVAAKHDSASKVNLFTTETLWLSRVAADALELVFLVQGRNFLKKLRFSKPEDRVPRYVKRVIGSDRVKSCLDSPYERALEPEDLLSAAHSIRSANSKSTAAQLPAISAIEPDRYQQGKAWVSMFKKWAWWDYQPIYLALLAGAAFALMAPVLFMTLEAEDATWTIGRRLSIGLTEQEALNINLQLLATAATLTVALAVAGRVMDPEQRPSMNRWWFIGRLALLLCGTVGVGLGALLISSTAYRSPLATGLGLMMLLLWAGTDTLRPERRFLAAVKGREVAALDRAIRRHDCLFKTNNEDLRANTMKFNVIQAVAFCLGMPVVLWAVIILGSARQVPVWSSDMFESALSGLMYCLLLISNMAWYVIWAIDVNEKRYRFDLTLSKRIQSLIEYGPLAVLYFLLHLFFWLSLIIGARETDSRVLFGIAILLLVPTSSLVFSWFKWPECPRRIARLRLERKRNQIRSDIDRLPCINK